MPTPVSAARQCLTDEAARALDEAVVVARRRSHAQTTSLHAVSALLALPSSILREACARARSSAYSPRLQFRALDLSVGVSLDRLPSSKAMEEPPVSNSLMAAIKRSQANQRRHPENFHLQQIHNQQNQQQTTSVLKVELKHFILSILDDPIVSRVFGEAGFRSCDVKIAIVHPPVTVASRLSRTRCPPIFLCNLMDLDPARRNLSFPFTGNSDFEEGDENCRRIGEILVRKTGKNPLLIGVCANDALNNFSDSVERGEVGVLPTAINGLSVISIEKEVSEFVGGGGSKEKMDLKLKEFGDVVKNCSGPGIVLNFGELKGMVDNGVCGDALCYLVSQFQGLLELHREKLWLMGAAGNYETYIKILARFPSIDKDWDLHLLPITSSKTSLQGFGSKSSLMGSFVPFGGFFSTPSDVNFPLSSTNEFRTRCHLCNEKYQQELSVLNGGSNASVADQYSATIPSWLQMTELEPSKGVDAAKAKDDGATFNAKVLGLQKKWDDICQHLHHNFQFPNLDISPGKTKVVGTEGLQLVGNKKESSSKDSSPSESGSAILCPYLPTDLHSPQKHVQVPVASEAENVIFQHKLPFEVSKSRQLETGSRWLSPYPRADISPPLSHMSSSSVTSVATDLGLGTIYAYASQKPKNSIFQDHQEHLQSFSNSVTAGFDLVRKNTVNHITKSSTCHDPEGKGQLNQSDFKSFWRVLLEKVGWQDEAIYTISQTVSRCRTGKRKNGLLRGDIWLSFLGPDKVGKKKIAIALAETVFGRRENIISIDLSSQDAISQTNSIFDVQELNGYDVKFRGKTVVDYIAGELKNRPHSVVFLENVDKADLQTQTSLSQAIRTGKFSDSHHREIGINDMIFVTTSTMTKGNKGLVSQAEHDSFPEERVLQAKRWHIQILVRNVAGDASRSKGRKLIVTPPNENSSAISMIKRKLSEASDFTDWDASSKTPKRAQYLDLNLPVAETEEEIEYGNCESDSISENSEAWLEEFFDQVDEKVTLKPFNFDALADKVLKTIGLNFQKTFGCEARLEIDNLVMVQMLAAAWLSDNKNAVEDWVEQVLGRSFTEAQQRYCITAESVVKLVACEGLLMAEQATEICLPARVNVG